MKKNNRKNFLKKRKIFGLLKLKNSVKKLKRLKRLILTYKHSLKKLKDPLLQRFKRSLRKRKNLLQKNLIFNQHNKSLKRSQKDSKMNSFRVTFSMIPDHK